MTNLVRIIWNDELHYFEREDTRESMYHRVSAYGPPIIVFYWKREVPRNGEAERRRIVDQKVEDFIADEANRYDEAHIDAFSVSLHLAESDAAEIAAIQLYTILGHKRLKE